MTPKIRDERFEDTVICLNELHMRGIPRNVRKAVSSDLASAYFALYSLSTMFPQYSMVPTISLTKSTGFGTDTHCKARLPSATVLK